MILRVLRRKGAELGNLYSPGEVGGGTLRCFDLPSRSNSLDTFPVPMEESPSSPSPSPSSSYPSSPSAAPISLLGRDEDPDEDDPDLAEEDGSRARNLGRLYRRAPAPLRATRKRSYSRSSSSSSSAPSSQPANSGYGVLAGAAQPHTHPHDGYHGHGLPLGSLPLLAQALPSAQASSSPTSSPLGSAYRNMWGGGPLGPLPSFAAVQSLAPPSKRLQQMLHTSAAVMKSSPSENRNWTREFQDILRHPLLERGAKLQKLCDDFVARAKYLGEIIIRERNLPLHLKTVKPISGKGLAGGEKYEADNIFFKFAVNQGNDLYPSDHYAMKVAGHELKGLTALVSCGMILGLSFPLLALIDWRGYRLIATSTLPISNETIIYGSCDGGNTVHKDSAEMNVMMEQLGKILNLKLHYTGLSDNRQWLYGPCDIEGHRGRDGKLYVVDTARIWPCETPDKNLKGGFLFKLLRGELVSRYPDPLSSDAFTAFGEHDSAVHNAQVASATNYLFHTIIPGFAATLPRLHTLSHATFIEELHRAGINVRHLGRVRDCVTDDAVRAFILLEMVARVLKNELRAQMRATQGSEDATFRLLAITFFNVIFGTTPATTTVWNNIIPARLAEQFPCPSQEPGLVEQLRCGMNHSVLFTRLQQLTGVHFSPTADLKRLGGFCQLGQEHLTGIEVIEKRMYAIPRIEADALAELARTKDNDEAAILYELARDKYRSAMRLKPDDRAVLQNLGTVLAALGKLHTRAGKDIQLAEPLFESAYQHFRCSLRLSGDDAKALNRWGNALCEHAAAWLAACASPSASDFARADALYTQACDKYERAHRLQPAELHTLFNWGNQLRHQATIQISLGRPNVARRLLSRSLQTYSNCTQLARRKKGTSTAPVHLETPGEVDETIFLDALINWGCGLLSLAKLNTADGEADLADQQLKQARQQFLKVAAVIKCENLLQRQPAIGRTYLAIVSYNLACIAAVQGDATAASKMLRQSLLHSDQSAGRAEVAAMAMVGPSLAFLHADPDLALARQQPELTAIINASSRLPASPMPRH